MIPRFYLFFIVLQALSIVGCATQRLKAQYQNDAKAIIVEYSKSMFLWDKMCEQAQSKGLSPHESPFDETPCTALLTTKYMEDLNSFSKECISQKKSVKTCLDSRELKELMDQHQANLKLRYRFGDFKEALLQCQAKKDCKDGLTYELSLLKTHNEYIIQALNTKLQELQTRHINADNYQRQQMSNALKNMGKAFERQPATNCWSTPNGAGGFYTTCQ